MPNAPSWFEQNAPHVIGWRGLQAPPQSWLARVGRLRGQAGAAGSGQPAVSAVQAAQAAARGGAPTMGNVTGNGGVNPMPPNAALPMGSRMPMPTGMPGNTGVAGGMPSGTPMPVDPRSLPPVQMGQVGAGPQPGRTIDLGYQGNTGVAGGMNSYGQMPIAQAPTFGNVMPSTQDDERRDAPMM